MNFLNLYKNLGKYEGFRALKAHRKLLAQLQVDTSSFFFFNSYFLKNSSIVLRGFGVLGVPVRTGGRRLAVDPAEVVGAIYYQLKTGCQ